MKPPDQSTDTYFQVPLCALAFGATHKERLDAIIDYGCMDVGRKHWTEKFDHQKRTLHLRAWQDPKRIPKDFDSNNAEHIFLMTGASVIGVRPGSVVGMLAGYTALCQFRDAFVWRNGPDAFVRLRKDLVFEARDNKGITPRELYVLAAIYSVIGDKHKPVMITRRRIAHRALGYKGVKVLSSELASRADRAQPLTVSMIRTTLDKLHARKFFVRATFARRHTYYSHRMTHAELRLLVAERKAGAGRFKTDCRREDQKMTETIRRLRSTGGS